jgi:hypothetical protein
MTITRPMAATGCGFQCIAAEGRWTSARRPIQFALSSLDGFRP